MSVKVLLHLISYDPGGQTFFSCCQWVVNQLFLCVVSLNRTLKLPVDVEMTSVDAKYKDGVLTVVLPKAEEAVPRKIEVTSEE